MKNISILIIIALFFNSIVFSQKVKPVPAAVRKSFSQKFPKIKRMIWDNSDVKVWEAEFRMQGNEYSVIFNVNGDWIRTEHEIDDSEIPSAVKSTLNKEFAGYKIGESKISETTDGKVYEFELKKEGKKAEIEIATNGKVVTKEQNEEENEDDSNNDE